MSAAPIQDLPTVLGVPLEDAWPLALSGTPLVPGDRILMTRAGEDSARWAAMATDLGYDVVCIDVPPGAGPAVEELTHLLWWDASIRAVFVAREETSTGVTADVAEVRRVIDLTGSDALLLVECAASWGTDGMQQRAWSADLVIAALGTPGADPNPGTLVTWSERLPGLGALPSQLDAVAGEGLSEQERRGLAEGLRRGLAGAGLEGLATRHPSDLVTVVHLPAPIQATRIEEVMAAHCLIATDLGVGALAGRVLRIWHSGLRNEVDVLSVVATVELALLAAGGPVALGSGLHAARSWFDDARADAA